MTEVIKIGTRGSNLALWQTRFVEKKLRDLYPEIEIHIQIIKTKGDKILDQALSKIEGKGLFTKEIEDRLSTGEIDLAVHSLKDLPTELPEGLICGAILFREDPSDALLCKHQGSITELPQNAAIYTSSLRRKSQLLSIRPDLEIFDVRGNVETRIKKFHDNKKIDGIILAKAGLVRLGLDNLITSVLDPKEFLPACGQGALAVEIREDDNRTAEIITPLKDGIATLTTTAERSFLAEMGGGCQVPMGAFSWIEGDELFVRAFCSKVDGTNMIIATESGDNSEAKEVGIRVANKIKKQN